MLQEKIINHAIHENEALELSVGAVEKHLEELGGWRHDLPFSEAIEDLNKRIEAERQRKADSQKPPSREEIKAAEQNHIKNSIRPVLTPPAAFAPPVGAILANLANGAKEKARRDSGSIVIRRATRLEQAVDNFNHSLEKISKKPVAALLSAFSLAGCAYMLTPSLESTPVLPSDDTAVFEGDHITIPLVENFCSPNSPLTVQTSFGNHIETDNDMCRRILQAVPAPSERFTQYDRNTGVRALANGTFEFRLVTFKEEQDTLEKLVRLQNSNSVFGNGERRDAYMDSYAFTSAISEADARDDFYLADKYLRALSAEQENEPYNADDLAYEDDLRVQRAIKFRQENPLREVTERNISANDYKSVVTAWLISPLPFAFYLKKWNLESGMDGDARAPTGTACGVNQFTSPTFLTVTKLYADDFGLDKLYSDVMTISRRHGHDDRKTIRDPEYRAIFNRTCTNVRISTALGAVNTTDKIETLQEMVSRGDIHLPFGRTRITEIDGYIGHFLNGNMVQIYRALENTPDIMMKDLVSPSVYRGNRGLFEGRTVTEFYNNLSDRYGFGTRALVINPSNMERLRAMVNAADADIAPVTGIGTDFRIVANASTRDQTIQLAVRPNVNWISRETHGVSVEPL